MPTFLYPLPLALIAGLIALPVLIHLINMLRHRRVQWAAMEFLLQSQKRNRTWIVFKQLLLLLMRMAAVAAVILMVTQPVLRDKFAALFGGSKTHHLVLLDDSLSMTDRWSDTSAFDEALKVIDRLGKQASGQAAQQEFTLLRFSQAGRLDHSTRFDLVNEPVDSDFRTTLEERINALRPSETAVGPGEALSAITPLVREAPDTGHIVYLVTDLRAKEWESAGDLRKALLELNEAGAQVRLVHCVDRARANLTITELKAAPGTRAVGVPLRMNVAVKNQGTETVRGVSVQLEQDGHPREGLEIEEIGPGETISQQFEVKVLTAGEHRFAASLQADTVAADNARHAVFDFPLGVPVLLIDGGRQPGDSDKGDAYFLATALAPATAASTGIKPQIESPRYLRDRPLDGFAAIYLLNVARLDQAEIDALETYVKQGGGVAFFLGDQVSADFFNEKLYRDGEGVFPLPLVAQTELLVDRLNKAPDLEISNHPIFAVFSGQRNPYIGMVNVERYFAAQKDWKPSADSTAAVVARLRNGAPLAVEKKFGDGRVMAFLTTAGPAWNNWARDNPSYVVAMLELQSYLSAGRKSEESRLVGTPLELRFDAAQFVPQVQITTPQSGAAGVLAIEATPTPEGLTTTLAETFASGVYEVQLTKTDGATQSLRYAFNVLPEEGDLKTLDGTQLAPRLEGVAYQYQPSQDLYYDAKDLQGANLSSTVLYSLIGLLVGEQLLAYSASYHTTTRK